MRNDAKLGLMPAALDRIYEIMQNFSWVDYAVLITLRRERKTWVAGLG